SSGENTILMADFLSEDPGEINLENFNLPRANVVELRVDPTLQTSGSLPETLNDIAYFDRADATQVRTFSLEMDGGEEDGEVVAGIGNMDLFSINGSSMSMGVINEEIKMGEVEIWRITGEEMAHPFHMHGVSFQILTHNGAPPAEADRGWKDTVVVGEEVTEIILRFDYEATEAFPYMYHCHIFEHEDSGMMGQFTVQK
ncbi:MAG: multicopper oxidase domain-containing protein, partial [Chloroflexota bacterium]